MAFYIGMHLHRAIMRKSIVYLSLLLAVFVFAACSVQRSFGPGSIAIAQVDLEDRIGRYSPMPVPINIWSEQGALNVRDSLSNRALRVVYENLEDALAPWGTVMPHMDRQGQLQLRFPGWPAHTVAEGVAMGADYVVLVTGRLQARKLSFRVRGVRGSRLVPVVTMQIRIYNSAGRLVRKVQGKAKGDPTVGSTIQSGDWQIGQGNVVLEKDIIDLCRQLYQQFLMRPATSSSAAS